MQYKKILVSLDGIDQEKPVITEAMQLAKDMHSNLTVIHVNDPHAGKAHMMMNTLPKVSENDIREQFKKSGFQQEADQISVLIMENANYPKAIAETAKDMDLLIIGHRHKNKVSAFFKDSVDERLTDMVSCPMLVIPETAH